MWMVYIRLWSAAYMAVKFVTWICVRNHMDGRSVGCGRCTGCLPTVRIDTLMRYCQVDCLDNRNTSIVCDWSTNRPNRPTITLTYLRRVDTIQRVARVGYGRWLMTSCSVPVTSRSARGSLCPASVISDGHTVRVQRTFLLVPVPSTLPRIIGAFTPTSPKCVGATQLKSFHSALWQ